MKRNFIFWMGLFLSVAAFGQGVKISASGGSPDASSLLELESTTRGFLPPRMTTAERDGISNPQNGLMIYNSDIDCMEYYRGAGNGWYSACPMLPVVITNSITSITGTSATGGGSVNSDGGSTVTARGVCWSTNPGPTLSDSFTSNGIGVGNFVSSLTGLTEGVTYYVRAYATNGVGTAYGNEETFTTIGFPVVTTSLVTSIGANNASGGGEVLSDGGATVSARGICWSTSSTPDLSDSFTTNGSGLGTFTSALNGLVQNTTYYVRAYATNLAGTAYGDEEVFTTLNPGPIIGAGTTYPGTLFTASSTLDPNRGPDRAFDNSLHSVVGCWHSVQGDATNSWIKVQFPQAKTVTSYRMWRRSDNEHIPDDWVLEGSNNDSDWNIIDTRVNSAPPTVSSDNVAGSPSGNFTVSSPGSYIYYRLRASETANGNNYTVIGEIEYTGF